MESVMDSDAVKHSERRSLGNTDIEIPVLAPYNLFVITKAVLVKNRPTDHDGRAGAKQARPDHHVEDVASNRARTIVGKARHGLAGGVTVISVAVDRANFLTT